MRVVNGRPVTDRVIARNKIEHIALRVNFNGTAKTFCGKTVNIPYDTEHRKADSKCAKCYGALSENDKASAAEHPAGGQSSGPTKGEGL